MSNTYEVDDGTYYRLLAAQNGVKAAFLAVDLAKQDLAAAQDQLDAAHKNLHDAITENGKYRVTGDFALSEKERKVDRVPVE